MKTGTRVEHKGHTIIAAMMQGKAAAQVYVGDRMATKQRFQQPTLDAVIASATAWIDDKLSSSAAARRAQHIATPSEYTDFLSAYPLVKHQKAMLMAHARDELATMDSLALAAGYKSVKTAGDKYVAFAQAVAEGLSLFPLANPDGSSIWLSVMGDWIGDATAPDASWRMHPELIEAVNTVLPVVVERKRA